MKCGRIHATPRDAVGDDYIDTVLIGDATFSMCRPVDSERLLDHPAVRAAYADDEYIPYWANLWPAARMLAKAILKEPWSEHPLYTQAKPLEALEVGCGLGLPGVAALRAGLKVTFSDCDELALSYAVANAKRNGFPQVATSGVDFRVPPEGVQTPVLLGSDLMYEPRLTEPLVAFIASVLPPGGLALIADPDRQSAKPFRWMLQNAGLEVEAQLARAGEPGGDRTRGTVYRIIKPMNAQN
jgi:predicted nicotinamide N-methyase